MTVQLALISGAGGNTATTFHRKERKEANKYRGINYVKQAMEFLDEFPVGTRFSNEMFDNWAFKHNYLNIPTTTDKGSNEWMGHIHRRAGLRQNITLASTQPRLKDTYGIRKVAVNVWEVINPQAYILSNNIPEKAVSFVEVKEKKLRYFLEALNGLCADPYEQVGDYVSSFKRRMRFEATEFTYGLRQIERRVLKGESAKQIENL